MSVRRVHIVLAAVLGGVALVAACSPSTKHRVLRFFFDGVPEPGAVREIGYTPTGRTPVKTKPTRPKPIVREIFTHTPYRERRCSGCHDTDSMQILRTPQEGLCLRCHSRLVREPRYVHGPVVAMDCLFCHHHHSSAYPNILRLPPTETCFRCHQRADLTEGTHHADLEQQDCTQCHDPHGGENRFFLKRVDP